MADQNYPIGMYKDHGPDVEFEVRWAHTPKEQQAFAEAGFTDNYRNLPKNDYPHILYNADGEEMRVISKVEHDAAHEIGFTSRKQIAKKERLASAINSAESNGRLDRLEDEVSGIKDQLVEILNAITSKGKK